ncbi:GNAT family N-acetyltransferase [Paraconexibacter algicola]|uniref:GNAT family N-acetyltransferase n=1 Tax=Paraconexibacter algicola TaxID=2133960 RepID=UPI001304883E|nr:GNAT family N-acetyltransferase [Paraconexibacter algicola]
MSDLEATAELLAATFPESGVGDVSYLRWLYREAPDGPVIETNLDDALGRAAHYALVPVPLTVDGAPVAGAVSLNTAVHHRARGGGVFTRLAQDTLGLAVDRGVELVVGVANANSTPGFTRRLDFTSLGPLPARVHLPTGPGRGVSGTRVDQALLADPALREELARRLAVAPRGSGITRRWTVDALLWRLARPGARYSLHRLPGVLAVSTVQRTHGVPVAVVLKVLADDLLSPREARRLVNGICRHHRAPLGLHVGVAPALPLRNLRLPDRLRPSPLNFIVRALPDGTIAPASLGTFELLDFDAY